MEITYSLTREDYFQFNKFLAKRTRGYYTYPAACGAIAAATCTLLVRTLSDFSLSWVILLVLTAGGLGSAFQFILMRRCLRRLPANADHLGTLAVRVEPEGVWGKTAISEGMLQWKGISQVVENPDYVYLLVDRHAGFIIPKRVFADLAAGKTFIDTARSYWESSRRPVASDR